MEHVCSFASNLQYVMVLFHSAGEAIWNKDIPFGELNRPGRWGRRCVTRESTQDCRKPTWPNIWGQLDNSYPGWRGERSRINCFFCSGYWTARTWGFDWSGGE